MLLFPSARLYGYEEVIEMKRMGKMVLHSTVADGSARTLEIFRHQERGGFFIMDFSHSKRAIRASSS